MRRKRFQRGCVRKTKHGRIWVWIGKYYEDGRGRSKVLGHCAQMTEGGAWARLQELLNPINETAGFGQTLPTDFREYVTNVFLPQRRKKWKDSTDKTTTERFKAHLLPAFDGRQLRDLTRDRLQRFLDQQDQGGLSKSVVSHLRWDLNAIFKMAADDGLIQGNPAGSLVTPKEAKTFEKRTYDQGGNPSGVVCIGSTGTDRLSCSPFWSECALARFSHSDGDELGRTWSTSWNGYTAAAESIPRQSEGNGWLRFRPIWPVILQQWRDVAIDLSPESLVFPSERGTFMSRDNFLRRNIHNKLEKIGLGWVNFQVLRRTQASLGHKEGVDPKVAADQRGHAIGVAIDTYTMTDLETRHQAVTTLERALQVEGRSAGSAGFRGKQGNVV